MASSFHVDKGLLPVVIYTATHRIEGFYHTFDDGRRILDDLNGQGRAFIPLTDARITKLQGQGHGDDLIVAQFVAISLHSITLFFPNPKVVAPSKKGSSSRGGAEESRPPQRMVESTAASPPRLQWGDAGRRPR